MKKTSLYLPDELDAALARRAADDGLSKAEFIRRGLEQVVDRPKRPRLSVGAFSSKGPHPAASIDDEVRDLSFGE